MIFTVESLKSGDGVFKLFLIAAHFSRNFRSFINNKISFIDEMLLAQGDNKSRIIFQQISQQTSYEHERLSSIMINVMGDAHRDIESVIETLKYLDSEEVTKKIGTFKAIISETLGKFYTRYLYDQLGNNKITQKDFYAKVNNMSTGIVSDKFDNPELSYEINMNEIKPEEIMSQYMDDVIKLPTSELNNLYPEGGLVRGQLGGIIASAGVGKSIYLQNIATSCVCFPTINPKKLNVAYFILADLNKYNFTTRHLSITLNESQFKVRDPKLFSQYFNFCKQYYPTSFDRRRLYVRYMAAGQFTAREIFDFLKEHYLDVSDLVDQPRTMVKMIDWFDVIIIDYEGVLKPDLANLGASPSLYTIGGDNANVLKQMADYVSDYNGKQKVVFAAMQPTKKNRENYDITVDEISESAQKARVIDFAYAFVSPDDQHYPNFTGKLRAVKGRNSETTDLWYFKDLSGRILVRPEHIIKSIQNLKSVDKDYSIRFTKIKSLIDGVNFFDLDGNIQEALVQKTRDSVGGYNKPNFDSYGV